uniref:Uncharacterized protein n=1 Tax=Tanacetum cinerariifolium TaxID=118510 RepID=A0A699IEP5_TANCI|nr:hypothetical protein [Tanacetum cinerariifolium]
MAHNDIHPIKVSINTKFHNSLQPEWRNFVTLTRQNKDLSDVKVDIQTKNVGYSGNPNRIERRQNRNQAANATNGLVQQIDENDNAKTEPKYDAEDVSRVNASHIDLISSMISKGVHEHTNHEKLKIVINTSDDDQIDCNIIFNDPYVENNSGIVEHDSNVHD